MDERRNDMVAATLTAAFARTQGLSSPEQIVPIYYEVVALFDAKLPRTPPTRAAT